MSQISHHNNLPPESVAEKAAHKAVKPGNVQYRAAEVDDLEAVNLLIEAAMSTWNVSARVRRISLPLYRYQPHDLEHLHMVIALCSDSRIVGVAALEPASGAIMTGRTPILHGLYVAPDEHRKGIGSGLLAAMDNMARRDGADGLLVKASPQAMSFFSANGYRRLPIRNQARDYPYRFYKGF